MTKLWLASAALLGSTALTQPVFGQNAPAPATTPDSTEERPTALGEIIVTARKREETLVDVPISITAITEEQLDKANIDDVSDLAQQTPGLSFRQGFGRTGAGQGGDASSRPSIRGMSNILGAPNASFFVDGVYVSGNITSYQLDNLARVEVIKGPQSALFGRQTFSGAVNFVTRRPDNDLSGKMKLTYGQYDHMEASGYLDGAIIKDVLKFEINGRSYDFGGDYFNQANGKRDIGDQRSRSVGGKVIFTPSDYFEATINLGYSHDRDKGFAIQLQGSQNNNCFLPNISGTILTPPLGNLPRALNRSTGYFCGEIESPENYAWNHEEIEARGYHPLDRRTFRSNIKLEASNEGGWTATSITAFNRSKNEQSYDNSYLPVPEVVPLASFSPTISRSRVKDLSQELRIATPQDGRLRALAGIYIYREQDGNRLNYNYARDARYLLDTSDGVRNKAVFGLIEFDATERLTVTAEARYQKEKIIGSNEAGVGAASTPRDVLLPVTVVRSAKFDAFLPRFTARYALNDDWNVYGSAAKGNKPGGFNDLPTNIRPADLAFFVSEGLDTYDEESAWSYEIGTKGSLFDRRAYFGASAFRVDWSEQQLTRSEPYVQASDNRAQNAAFIQNAGKSRINGFELDVSGRPSDWLYLRLAYTFVDAKFVDFNDENTERVFDTDGIPSFLPDDVTRNPLDTDTRNGQVRGNRLPQTPQHQFVVTGEVRQPVSGSIDAFFRSDVSYESKRYVQVDNLSHTGDSWLWNLAAGVETGNWTAQLWVENLLDDRTPAVVTRLIDNRRGFVSIPTGLANPATTAGRQATFFRDFLIAAPRKRQVGATVTYKF